MHGSIPPTLANVVAALGYTPVNKAGDSMSGPLLQADGALALPSYAFSGDATQGWYRATTSIVYAQGSTARMLLTTIGPSIVSGGVFRWSSGASALSAADTGLSRIGAGIVGVGNGSAASVAGELRALNVSLGNTGILKLGNTYVAGVTVPTGSLEISDQAGNVYLISAVLKP